MISNSAAESGCTPNVYSTWHITVEKCKNNQIHPPVMVIGGISSREQENFQIFHKMQMQHLGHVFFFFFFLTRGFCLMVKNEYQMRATISGCFWNMDQCKNKGQMSRSFYGFKCYEGAADSQAEESRVECVGEVPPFPLLRPCSTGGAVAEARIMTLPFPAAASLPPGLLLQPAGLAAWLAGAVAAGGWLMLAARLAASAQTLGLRCVGRGSSGGMCC